MEKKKLTITVMGLMFWLCLVVSHSIVMESETEIEFHMTFSIILETVLGKINLISTSAKGQNVSQY